MKKIIIVLTMIIAIMISGCSQNESLGDLGSMDETTNGEAALVSDENNEPMTQEQYDKAYRDFDKYVWAVLKFSQDFAELLNNHPEIFGNSGTVNMSVYPEFVKSRSDLIEVSDKISAYDTSGLSDEFKYCFELLATFASSMVTYADELSEDISFEEFQHIVLDCIMPANEEFSKSLDDALTLAEEAFQQTKNMENGTKENSLRFTNEYGTPTTKCAHTGCSNYIAPTGDTNCCTKHSHRCLDCGIYIDEDATYCVSCIKKSIGGEKVGDSSSNSSVSPKPENNDSNTSNSTAKTGCQYKYPDGSICGAKCTDYPTMCNKHFNELYATYSEITGK